MARTLKSDLPSGHFHIGNGSSIVNPAFPILDMGRFSHMSDFTITSPNVKIDVALKKIAARVGEKLRFKSLKYLGDESDWNLVNVLKLPDGTKDNAKAKLMRDGKSAVISKVSKAINASSLDHSSKYLLSVEPLYVYALSYVIYHEEVEDSEGMDDRIQTVTDNKIRTYLNKLLAKKYIQEKHINLSREQEKQIMEAAGSTTISYVQGQPAIALGRIISKYVDYGDLNMLVDKFFKDGPIDPEKGTPQVRQLMVKYLADIGLTVSSADFTPAGSSSGGGGDIRAAGSTTPSATSPMATDLRTGPSVEETREPGGGMSGGAVEGPLPKDAEAEIKKRVAEMDIERKKESAGNPAPALQNPKSSKSAK